MIEDDLVDKARQQSQWETFRTLCGSRLTRYHRNITRRTPSSTTLCVVYGRGVSIPRNTRVWQNIIIV